MATCRCSPESVSAAAASCMLRPRTCPSSVWCPAARHTARHVSKSSMPSALETRPNPAGPDERMLLRGTSAHSALISCSLSDVVVTRQQSSTCLSSEVVHSFAYPAAQLQSSIHNAHGVHTVDADTCGAVQHLHWPCVQTVVRLPSLSYRDPGNSSPLRAHHCLRCSVGSVLGAMRQALPERSTPLAVTGRIHAACLAAVSTSSVQ